MARRKLLPDENDGSFLGRLGSAIDNTFQQVDYLSDLSRNAKLLKEPTVPFIEEESRLLEHTDDIHTETKTFYQEVKNNPINLNDMENRLLNLRAALIEINDNPTLINKGLQPFVPVRSVPITDSSYLSPVSNRSQQSSRLSFASSAKPVNKGLQPFTPLRSMPIIDSDYLSPVSNRPQQSASLLSFTPAPAPQPASTPAFNQNFANPQLNSVMAKLRAFNNRPDDE